jgi:hypothetical protein
MYSVAYLLVFGWISQCLSTRIARKWPHYIAIMKVREEIKATLLQTITKQSHSGKTYPFLLRNRDTFQRILSSLPQIS